MSKSVNWICPRCFGGNPNFKDTCSWCEYRLGTGLSEADVAATMWPHGEILSIVSYTSEGPIDIRLLHLQMPSEWPGHVNWRIAQ